MFPFLMIIVAMFALGVQSDPIPHTQKSKLYIISRMAFTYLDDNNDGRLSQEEFDDVRQFTVNGILPRSKAELKRLHDSMNSNKNNFIEENEFLNFEKWLPLFVNGSPRAQIKVRDLERYGSSIAYSQLDQNRDGIIDEAELTKDR